MKMYSDEWGTQDMVSVCRALVPSETEVLEVFGRSGGHWSHTFQVGFMVPELDLTKHKMSLGLFSLTTI